MHGIFQRFRLNQQASYTMLAKRDFLQNLLFATRVRLEHFREGMLLGTYWTHNDIVNQGKNDILGVYFNNGTQTTSTSWFLGLIDITGFTALAPTDLMNSHSGWTEFIGYSQSTRVAWGPGTPSGQSITNASAAQFDVNANGTIKGIFVCTNSFKNGTTGLLWATALYGSDVPVVIGDQIRATYTLSC